MDLMNFWVSGILAVLVIVGLGAGANWLVTNRPRIALALLIVVMGGLLGAWFYMLTVMP